VVKEKEAFADRILQAMAERRVVFQRVVLQGVSVEEIVSDARLAFEALDQLVKAISPPNPRLQRAPLRAPLSRRALDRSTNAPRQHVHRKCVSLWVSLFVRGLVVLVCVTACSTARCPATEQSSRFSRETPTTITQTQAEPLIDLATRHIIRVCRYKPDQLTLLGVVERDGRTVVQIIHTPSATGYDVAVDPATHRITSFRAWSP